MHDRKTNNATACFIVFTACSFLAVAQESKPSEAFSVSARQKASFELMNVEKAWGITRGSTDCQIGVIDTGFDFFHPSLKDTLKPGYFASEVYHTSSNTLVAHGTIIASLLSARSTGAEGMVGYAPGCTVLAASIGMPEHKLLLLQQEFFARNPGAKMADWQKEMAGHIGELQSFNNTWLDYVTRSTAESIKYLVDRGVRVINISAYLPRRLLMSNPAYAERLDHAFEYAIEEDVVIVIGSGNINIDVSDYPGSNETVLVVGASTLKDERWTQTSDQLGMQITQGSCFGARLSVMAPSEAVLVALPHENSYYTFQDTPAGKERAAFESAYQVMPFGATSCATPVVSALAALVRSVRPDLPAKDVVAIIKQGAVDIGEKGVDIRTGHGRVDFYKTLTIAREWKSGTKDSIEE